jgi:D-mannonate dehydratase
MDDGYYNMYKIMEALVEVNFDGLVIPDHVPELGVPLEQQLVREIETASVSGSEGKFRPSPGLAYSMGYINATLKAVQANKRMS